MSTEQIVFGRRATFRPPPPPSSEEAGSHGIDALLDLLLSPQGRVSRLGYLRTRIGKNVVVTVLLIATYLLTVSLDGGVRRRSDLLNLAPLLLLSAWIDIALQIKRRRALDQSWRRLFGGFIPILGWFRVWSECGFKDERATSGLF